MQSSSIRRVDNECVDDLGGSHFVHGLGPRPWAQPMKSHRPCSKCPGESERLFVQDVGTHAFFLVLVLLPSFSEGRLHLPRKAAIFRVISLRFVTVLASEDSRKGPIQEEDGSFRSNDASLQLGEEEKIGRGTCQLELICAF